MRLCIDLNSDLTWEISDFMIIPHHTESELVLNYYEYKIRTNDQKFIDWVCQDKRDILIYLEDFEEKYHELTGCSGIKEMSDLVSVKIWFYRTGTKNMSSDRVKFVESKVLSYKRTQVLKKLDI